MKQVIKKDLPEVSGGAYEPESGTFDAENPILPQIDCGFVVQTPPGDNASST